MRLTVILDPDLPKPICETEGTATSSDGAVVLVKTLKPKEEMK